METALIQADLMDFQAATATLVVSTTMKSLATGGVLPLQAAPLRGIEN